MFNGLQPQRLVAARQCVKQASPLPQAAHIGVCWVQRVAQTNQEARKQQDGGALQSRHGPEGRKRTDVYRWMQKPKHFRKDGTRPKHILIVTRGKNEPYTIKVVQRKEMWF